MAKVLHQREECIGCAACVAIYPDGWEMNEDGKSDLKGGKEVSPNVFEKEISDPKEEELHKEAADSCPTSIIHVK